MMLECDTGAEWLVYEKRDKGHNDCHCGKTGKLVARAPVSCPMCPVERPLTSHSLTLAFIGGFPPEVIGLAPT